MRIVSKLVETLELFFVLVILYRPRVSSLEALPAASVGIATAISVPNVVTQN